MDLNYIQKVAIVGAGGNVGRYITAALLEKHTVTALTRADSQTKVPEGVVLKTIDYDKPETLVEALTGQDALIITLSGHAPIREISEKLIKAASKANVAWVLPNEWGFDTENEALVKDISVVQPSVAVRNAFRTINSGSYIAVSTGFWYEWSLAIPAAFGIDLLKRTATLFDDGKTKISISTWTQVGRAVAALLSLPIKPDGSGRACLEDFKNKMVYVNSFTISQRDMLNSAIRVTGTKESDWAITVEPSHERYATGVKEMQQGKRIGFAKMMYTRVFYPDGSGDTEHSKGTINALLNLPTEDIDEATKAAIERAKKTGNWVEG